MTNYEIYGTELMTYDNLVERAIALAVDAHSGQVDKQGAPYILHVLRVGLKGQTEEERVVGILHDLFEDTDWTFEDLLNLGFSNGIVNAILALTYSKWMTHTDYYNHVKANTLALRVKKYDIDDNYGRLYTIKDKGTRERLQKKYTFAREYLFDEPPGTIYY